VTVVRLGFVTARGEHIIKALNPRPPEVNPTIRLVASTGPTAMDRALMNPNPARPPALLVSFYYLKRFLRVRDRLTFRDWSMDSGAYSAANSGVKIDLAEYIETCKELMATDPMLVEVFSLDVIGDHKASRKNTEAMWKAGVECIPTFHLHEPDSALIAMAKDYPKISLGGVVGYRDKNDWAAQCFARVWPKRIHGLGFGSEQSVLSLPFESVDATNWETGPAKFGRWQTYGELSVPHSRGLDLRSEVEWYLKLEDRARIKWRNEMAMLRAPTGSPAMRLVIAGTQQDRLVKGFGMKPKDVKP
jgi:hypothetical protein